MEWRSKNLRRQPAILLINVDCVISRRLQATDKVLPQTMKSEIHGGLRHDIVVSLYHGTCSIAFCLKIRMPDLNLAQVVVFSSCLFALLGLREPFALGLGACRCDHGLWRWGGGQWVWMVWMIQSWLYKLYIYTVAAVLEGAKELGSHGIHSSKQD